MKIINIMPGIVAGTIVFYCIRPIMDFLGRIVMSIAETISSTYIDRFYAEIATGGIDYAFVLVLYSSGFLFGMCIAPLFTILSTNTNKDTNKDSSVDNTSIIGKVFYFCFFSFIGLSILFFAVDNYMRVTITSSFNQYVTVLSPYITDKEQKLLRSNFASMRNKKDYSNILNSISDMAKSKSIILPENKQYGFDLF